MKREELWTPSARRFECLLKAAQNGDYNAYMSLMARFFKVMDDKARNNYLRDYEMFTALVERVSEGIFGFSSEDAYQRELNKEKHPQAVGERTSRPDAVFPAHQTSFLASSSVSKIFSSAAVKPRRTKLCTVTARAKWKGRQKFSTSLGIVRSKMTASGNRAA